eukprot:jgi/Ulvmu1/947/UM102_0030.1
MPNIAPMMQIWRQSGSGSLMYFFLWAALLCCRVVKSMSTNPLSRSVTTARQLVDAVRDGVRHIEVRSHIDLRTIATHDQLTGALVVPAEVQTIRGNCSDMPTMLETSADPLALLTPAQAAGRL